jgi:hypothetical protein
MLTKLLSEQQRRHQGGSIQSNAEYRVTDKAPQARHGWLWGFGSRDPEAHPRLHYKKWEYDSEQSDEQGRDRRGMPHPIKAANGKEQSSEGNAGRVVSAPTDKKLARNGWCQRHIVVYETPARQMTKPSTDHSPVRWASLEESLQKCGPQIERYSRASANRDYPHNDFRFLTHYRDSSTKLASLFLTLPTRLLTGHAVITLGALGLS